MNPVSDSSITCKENESASVHDVQSSTVPDCAFGPTAEVRVSDANTHERQQDSVQGEREVPRYMSHVRNPTAWR